MSAQRDPQSKEGCVADLFLHTGLSNLNLAHSTTPFRWKLPEPNAPKAMICFSTPEMSRAYGHGHGLSEVLIPAQELDIRARHQGNQQAIGGGDRQLALETLCRCGDPSGEKQWLLS